MPLAYTEPAQVVKQRFPLTYVSGSRIIRDVMNVLAQDRKLAVIAAHVEGNSIRSIERMTGVHRDTIMRLILSVGDNCARLLDERIRSVRAQRVQVDEIWTFVFKKQARLNGDGFAHPEMGDQYVFIGIDADTKLVISHLVGKRDAATAFYFIRDLKERLANRVQLTTDGFRPYLGAVEDAFGADVDYAQLVKIYGQPVREDDSRDWYKPVRVMAAIPMRVTGDPKFHHISTSYIERQNLTIRMQLRRFTRLTNGFSKKLENLKAAIALHFAHYNFVRIHQTLRITPAMAAGVTDHVWELGELAA
jgi:IS1 family transposase